MIKKKLLILALVVIFASVALFALLSPEPPTARPAVSTFLGFTNGARGAMARFSVRDYPEEATPFFDMAYWENGEWHRWMMLTGGWPDMQISFTPGQDPLVTFTVPTTNQPLRFVVDMRDDVTGLRGVINRLWMAMTSRRRPPPFRGRSLIFTNETVVGAVKTSQP